MFLWGRHVECYCTGVLYQWSKINRQNVLFIYGGAGGPGGWTFHIIVHKRRKEDLMYVSNNIRRNEECLIPLTLNWLRYFPPAGAGGGGGWGESNSYNPHFKKTLSQWNKNCTIDRVRQTMIICEKKFRFKMAAILLSFLPRDCAIPRKFKKHSPEGEFQRNLAR